MTTIGVAQQIGFPWAHYKTAEMARLLDTTPVRVRSALKRAGIVLKGRKGIPADQTESVRAGVAQVIADIAQRKANAKAKREAKAARARAKSAA